MFNWYFASGDVGFFWKEQIQAFSWFPQVSKGIYSLWLDYPFRLAVKLLSTIGLSWFVIEKILWVTVFALALYSSYKLTKSVIGSLMYVTNTYLLLLFGGGQLGVAFAYAYSPLVLYRLMKHTSNIGAQIINGLCTALLITFDLRIAYLILLATAFWWYRRPLFLFVAGTLHLFWILPVILARSNLPQEITNTGMLKFLSFADFSHTISLLHPNWPENLFGKVYFMQPEFMLIPIIAFSALFLRGHNIRFFALLALMGAFFAKGTQEPFGGIFSWMFIHIPGFVMFRDPTKFYIYIAIAYSVLIPLVLQNKKLLRVLFVIFWIFTLRGFSLQPTLLPQEYVDLKNLLVADKVPSRILWIPQKENFAYYSDVHPIVEATGAALIDSSVRYVIVPIDVNKKIFLKDYKFDPGLREKVISNISLPQVAGFSELAVFHNQNFTQMNSPVNEIAQKQQYFANIGALMSVFALVIFICILVF